MLLRNFNLIKKEKEEWITSNSSSSRSCCIPGWPEIAKPALVIWSLKNLSFLDISAHRFTCNHNQILWKFYLQKESSITVKLGMCLRVSVLRLVRAQKFKHRITTLNVDIDAKTWHLWHNDTYSLFCKIIIKFSNISIFGWLDC